MCSSFQRSKLDLAFLALLSVCERYFIGRNAFVVDVLSMIHCSASDGRQRQREGETQREMSLRGYSRGKLAYIIHRLVSEIGVLM